MSEQTLQEKLFLMQGLAPYMQKDSKAYNFNYVNEESVLAFVRPLLKQFGIQAYPEITEQRVERVEVLSKGKPAVEFLFTGTGAIKLHDFTNKETIEVPWVFTGSNSDPSQAFGSAMTYCMRYFWLKFLQIPTGNDDPDKWRSDYKSDKRADTHEVATQKRGTTENVSAKPPKTSKQVISRAQLEELTALAVNPDGKPNDGVVKILRDAYKSCGFDSAKDITTDKFQIIKEATEKALLPFELGD